jgi:hypothetical protein
LICNLLEIKKTKQKKLEAQWAEPVSFTCLTNQKQELTMAVMLVYGLKQMSNLNRVSFIDASY